MAEDAYARSPLERLTLENLSLQWQVDAAEADNADLRHQLRRERQKQPSEGDGS